MLRRSVGPAVAALMLLTAGCPPYYGQVPDEAPILPAPQMFMDDFKDVAFAQQGFSRRLVAKVTDGQVLSVVYNESNPTAPTTRTTALPGIVIERLLIKTITPGTIDLIIKTTTGIIFLEGQADGTFAGPPRTIFTGKLNAVDANSVTFADVDNDGDIDLIGAGSRPDTTPPNSVEARLLINDGNGNFTNPSTLQQPNDIVVLKSISAGDVDNDGRTEIAISGLTTRLLVVNNYNLQFYSTSTGQSQPSPTSPIEGTSTDSILSDLNNDGRADYIATNSAGGVGVRLAQPGGGLGPLQNYNGGLFGRIIAGDFNSDGAVDVAAHSFSTADLWIYNGDSSGALAPPKVLAAPRSAFRLDFVPPLPGSTLPAFLFTVDPTYHIVQTYTVGPDGPVSTGRRPYTRDGDPVSTKDAAIADVNGDGYPDLIASESNVPEFNFALNTADGSGQFLPNNHDRLSLLNRIAPMRPIDQQGDDRAAVAVTRNDTASVAIMRLNSTTNPTDWIAYTFLTLPEVPIDVATGDINNDGLDDAFFSHAGGNRALTVVLQEPGGAFTVGNSFFASGGAWNRIAAGDLNGDGRPEAIVLDTVSGQVRTLLNDGAGNFAPVAAGAIAFPPPLSADVAIADIDSDGKPDVILGTGPASLANGSVRVVRGNGQGGFLDSFSIASPGPVESVAVGDITGDGNNDLVFAVASGSPFVNGSLGFVRGTPTGLEPSASFHYISGDPKNVFIVDLKNPATSRSSRTANVSVLVAAYSSNAPYQGISVLNPIIAEATSCPADINNDGFVDDADFSLFVVAYNILDCADPAMPAGCPADLNADDLVDDADFSVFVVAYNEFICP